MSRVADQWSDNEEEQPFSPEADGHQAEQPIPGSGPELDIVAAAAQYWSDESADASPGELVKSQANEASVATDLWSDEDSTDRDGSSNSSDRDSSSNSSDGDSLNSSDGNSSNGSDGDSLNGSDQDSSSNGSDRDGQADGTNRARSGDSSDRHSPNSPPVPSGPDVQGNKVIAGAQLCLEDDDNASCPTATAVATQIWSDESGEESGEEGSQDRNDSHLPLAFQANDIVATAKLWSEEEEESDPAGTSQQGLMSSVTPSKITLSPHRFSATDFSL